MRHRLLKICVLLLSFTLSALPVQLAFASPGAVIESPHCHGMADEDSQAARESGFSNIGKISHGCCCDHCDASCGHCSVVVTAMILPATDTGFDAGVHEVYFSKQAHYTSFTNSPPFPPPLS